MALDTFGSELAAEYRVVALDMPAHGTHPDASFCVDRAIEDVGAVLEEVGPAVLVGHSLGGHVVMAAASTHDNQVDGLLGGPSLLGPQSTVLEPVSNVPDIAAPSH